MEATPAEPTVTITAARLAELEALAEIGLKYKERNETDFKRLSERHKANPAKHYEDVKRWREKNRDAINARRRELRRLKKEASGAADAAVAQLPAVIAIPESPGTK
jgi:hypothetical protein